MKPILFNMEMVRAILEWRKTVTRRVVKPQPLGRIAYCMAGYKRGTWSYPGDTTHQFWGEEWRVPDGLTREGRKRNWKAPCHTGDILYVQETWAKCQNAESYVYKADFDGYAADVFQPLMKWRPSIHMPKEAARLFLRVKDVRVERLQDMSEEDVVDEGAEPLIQCQNEHPVWDSDGVMYGMCWNEDCCGGHCDYIDKSYGELFGEIVWDRTIKPVDRGRYGWVANPWVWVIEFERCEKPERGLE